MASFETIVRPMILPNIRPTPQPVSFIDDPTKGLCVIRGQSAGTLTESYTDTVSIQRASATEDQRQFDEVRIHGKSDSSAARGAARAATADDPYIDVEVVNKIWLSGSDGNKFTRTYSPIEPDSNMTILRRNVTR